MKKVLANILQGGVFLVIGIAILGTALGFWNFRLFRGWWTMLIIIPMVVDMLINGIKFWNTTAFAIGIVLLLKAQNFFAHVNVGLLIIGLVLMAFGTKTICGGKNPFKKNNDIDGKY
ncbi:MAG: LiaF transmembrane domain-containing protein [Clostridium sp.]|uniref:LiaF transmembrane domain-containing protein n=1 Tax=Clostridium sp. TaxID=1506 RepID=UPI003EE52718